MSLLESLPGEMIHEILSFLQHDRPSLCSLARVNRFFGALSSLYIFRHVNLSIPDPHATTWKQIESFVRSVDERPSLTLQVQSLGLKWTQSHFWDTALAMGVQTNDLLSRLPNLQSLSLETYRFHRFNIQPFSLESSPMSSLRSITISDKSIAMDDVICLMYIKTIEYLRIVDMDGRRTSSDRHMEPTRTAAHLSTLCFGTSFYLPDHNLREVLCRAPALKDLSCNLPGREVMRGCLGATGTGDFDRKMTSSLSPAGIARALEPVRDSLVRLHLGDNAHTQWAGHDGSRMDLSQFGQLKTLRVESPCFFRDRVPDASRNGVYALLPPALEELDIFFPFNLDLVYNCKEQWHQFVANGYDVEASKYAWIEELAVHVPNLKRLVIKEQIKHPRGFLYAASVWRQLPATLESAFEAAAISAEIVTRKPLEVERVERERNMMLLYEESLIGKA